MFSYPPISTVDLGPVTVYTWGIFVGLGILAATWVAVQRGRRSGIAPQQLWDLVFWAVLAGIVGARALYVAEYWRDFVEAPWQAIAIWEGGMSAFGAILGGVPVGFWYIRLRRLPLPLVLHAVAPALLLGDAIGRLGGAASHMYPGTPTSFPVSYVLDGVQRHEVGIELALASLVGYLVILWIEHWPTAARWLGARLSMPWLVLLWYSLERFLLDFLRASDLPNSDLRYGGLTLAQYGSIIGVVVSVVLLFRRPRLCGTSHGGILPT